jgi:hypothetical protein
MPELCEMLALLAKCEECITKKCRGCGIADTVERIEDQYPELLEPK